MDLRDRLRLERPVVQAPMGGGLATAELASAVSRAGALGTIGILSPARLAKEVRRARALAPGRPVGVGLLMPFVRRAHVEVCVAERVDAVVLFFGFSRRAVERLRAGGVFVLHQVGTASEVRRAVREGADAVVAQGREAGGHLLGTREALAFLPDALEAAAGRPVLLSGGVADRRDTQAALDAGAAAVLCGSRFLLTEECRAHAAYKRRALGATRTIETELFGLGWPARHRVLPNAATERWCDERGNVPRGVRALLRATAPLGRAVPLDAAGLLPRVQRPGVPLYSPEAPLEGASERALDVSPLYAGRCVARVASVVPAEQAVRDLAP